MARCYNAYNVFSGVSLLIVPGPTMLRPLVLLLILANLSYFAWSQRWLASYGLAPVAQSEPQRLAQQIAPQTLRLLTAQEAAQVAQAAVSVPVAPDPVAVAPVPAPTHAAAGVECLQAGLFTDAQAAKLREVLQTALPAGSWQLAPHVQAARWMIYMGKYDSNALLEKKKAQLRYLKLTFTPLLDPTLEPGLSLGSFATQPQAKQALDKLSQRGIRTAKVIQERPEVSGQQLKLAAVDAALHSKLVAIKPDLAGKVLQECR